MDRQTQRKNSLEQRGITVITTSSVLATIVFTATATITKIHGVERFSTSEHILIAIAVAIFLCAGITALAVNIPARYGEVDPASIEGVRDFVEKERNAQSQTDTHVEVTGALVDKGIDFLKIWQKKNKTKANILALAFSFEMAAVLVLLVVLLVFLLP